MIISANSSIAGVYPKECSKDKTLGDELTKAKASYEMPGYETPGKDGNIQIDYNEIAFESLGPNAPAR